MRIIVDGQNLRVEGARMLSAEELRETRMDFTFSRDWDRYVKFAHFTQQGRTWNRMLVDNQCRIPPEIGPGDFYLHVSGMTPDNHDRVSTFYVVIQVPGGMPGMSGSMPNPVPMPVPGSMPSADAGRQDSAGPRDSLYTEITAKVNEAIQQGMADFVDTTLAREGKAAESKATGAAIQALEDMVRRADQESREQLTGAMQQMETRLQNTCGATDEVVVALRGEVAEVRQKVSQAQAASDSAIAQAASVREDTAADIRRLTASLEREENARNRLTERLEVTEGKTGAASQTVQEVRRDVTAVQDRVSRLENDSAVTGTKVQTLTGQMESMERQTKDILRSIDTLNQSVLSTSVAVERMRDMGMVRPQQMSMPMPQSEDPYRRDQMRDLRDRVDRLSDEVRTVRGKLDENTGNDRESDAQVRDRLREMEKALEIARQSLQSATEQLGQVVRRDQGRHNAGRVLGVLQDGQVAAVDMRMAGQAQSDFVETDETNVAYIRNNPFRLLNGYPMTDGLILKGMDGKPYLLTVNEAGELTLNEFV